MERNYSFQVTKFGDRENVGFLQNLHEFLDRFNGTCTAFDERGISTIDITVKESYSSKQIYGLCKQVGLSVVQLYR